MILHPGITPPSDGHRMPLVDDWRARPRNQRGNSLAHLRPTYHTPPSHEGGALTP